MTSQRPRDDTMRPSIDHGSTPHRHQVGLGPQVCPRPNPEPHRRRIGPAWPPDRPWTQPPRHRLQLLGSHRGSLPTWGSQRKVSRLGARGRALLMHPMAQRHKAANAAVRRTGAHCARPVHAGGQWAQKRGALRRTPPKPKPEGCGLRPPATRCSHGPRARGKRQVPRFSRRPA